jgi:hypothetical protein
MLHPTNYAIPILFHLMQGIPPRAGNTIRPQNLNHTVQSLGEVFNVNATAHQLIPSTTAIRRMLPLLKAVPPTRKSNV